MSPHEAGVPSPIERAAKGVFNWSIAASQWVKHILNSDSNSENSVLSPAPQFMLVFLYGYVQYKSPIGWLGRAFGWLCCFSCLKGMAFINTERELGFCFVIIHIREAGKVITMGILLIPEAVGPT